MLAPRPLLAQSAEIQHHLEHRMWFQRLVARIEAAPRSPPGCAPPLLSLTTLALLLLAILVAAVLWAVRRRRSE